MNRSPSGGRSSLRLCREPRSWCRPGIYPKSDRHSARGSKTASETLIRIQVPSRFNGSTLNDSEKTLAWLPDGRKLQSGDSVIILYECLSRNSSLFDGALLPTDISRDVRRRRQAAWRRLAASRSADREVDPIRSCLRARRDRPQPRILPIADLLKPIRLGQQRFEFGELFSWRCRASVRFGESLRPRGEIGEPCRAAEVHYYSAYAAV
jgi:hypothetical protein